MLAVLLAARAFAVGDAATELDGSWTVARVDRTGTSSGSARRSRSTSTTQPPVGGLRRLLGGMLASPISRVHPALYPN